ncbi:MAG: TonB-dependent receptor, partial [Bdellovibrionales bacterium]|nr:TonB-dependent receptor [Bdellovibrionales bacterium]
AKTGDSDAAASLSRVTGLTLKEGKYIYVRGLGERYSATLFNGVALPSPDPSRRVVPLDLFPVQFLESMVVQKSYSPDMPGQFGGGVVMLQTKSLPEKFFVKASIGQSFYSNLNEIKTYQGGSTDWMGVDDGGRKLPPNTTGENRDLSTFLEKNRHRISDQGTETLPEVSFSVGDIWNPRKFKLGYTLSGLYKDGASYRDEKRHRYRQQDGQFFAEQDFNRRKWQKERVLGGIGTWSAQYSKDHSITANVIGIRNTTDYVAIQDGTNAEGNRVRTTEREWAARTLNSLLVQGDNKIASDWLGLGWHYSQSRARRDEPDRITDRYSPDKDGRYVFGIAEDTAYQRRFYDLQERVEDIGLDLSSKLPWFYKKKLEVSLGTSLMRKDRQSNMRRFGLNLEGPCDADLHNNLDSIIDQCKEAFSISDNTQNTDTYTATQNLTSYYFRSQVPLLSRLDLSTGIRYERSIQDVNTLAFFSGEGVSSVLTTNDWLPGTSLTYKLNKKMQVRAAYSETISRPDLRELSDTRWRDFDTGYDITGNPDLKATVISNYDLRWEWYFAPRENISFGLFYKNFENPIEQEFRAASDPRIQFLNAEGARSYGGELEFAKRLKFITPWLRNFSISGNYAYIFSRVNLGNLDQVELSEPNRPMQGQSNYTANLLLDYENEVYRLNASLAYNVYGRRVTFSAPEGLPNVWEEPFHQLNLVIGKNLSENLKITGKVVNILDGEYRYTQGGQLWRGGRRGQTYTIGLSMEI